MPPRLITVPAGLASVAVSPDGRLVAAARGDGRVTIFDRQSGRLAKELSFGDVVVKNADFSPDGGRLAVGISLAGISPPHLFEVGTWKRLPIEQSSSSPRRLLFDARGALVSLQYNTNPAVQTWSPTGERRGILGPEMIDLAATADRRDLVMLAVDGGVHRLRDGVLTQIADEPGAGTIAVWPRRERIAAGHDTTISVRDLGGEARIIPNPVARITDLAVSPDERYLVGARIDGTVAVWRTSDGAPVATLRGHRQRAAHLTFAPDGILVTAGWDGRILRWDLSVLDDPPDQLIARAQAAWAVDVDLALRSVE